MIVLNLKDCYATVAQVTSAELKESVELLGILGESKAVLAADFLVNNRLKLKDDLRQLSSHEGSTSTNGELVLHFIDACCNTVLNNVALTIATFNNLFTSGATSENR